MAFDDKTRRIMAKLTFVFEDGEEVVVPLGEHTTIGRVDTNDVVVDDARISEHHAELLKAGNGRLELRDLKSDSGTFVNDERIESHILNNGDRLAFGPLKALLDLEEPDTPADKPRSEEAGRISMDAALRSSEQRLTALQAAASQAESAHQQWLDAIKGLSTEYDTKVAALEKLNVEHDEKAAAVQHLSDAEAEAQAKIEKLTLDQEKHLARLSDAQRECSENESRRDALKQSIAQLESSNAENLKLAESRLQDAAKAEEKLAELEQKVTEVEARLTELTGTEEKLKESAARLDEIRRECIQDEARRDQIRQDIADAEARSAESLKLAESRQQEASIAEKKLEELEQRRSQIETHLQELAGAEEKLTQSLARSEDAEAKHATLTAAIAALMLDQQRCANTVQELESRIAPLQDSYQEASAAADAARKAQKEAEESLLGVRSQLAECQNELNAETRRIDEAKLKRAELEAQCQSLAGVEQQLKETQAQLAATEKRHADFHAAYAKGEASIAELTATLEKIGSQEKSARERLEGLREREKNLRTELETFATTERNARTRLEDIRKLAQDEQQKRTAEYDKLTFSIDTARNELAELESKLSLLRDWKEATTQRKARLADLPKDSPEARDIWNEIENEKEALLSLLTTPHSRGPRIMHVELARLNTISRLAMKSERTRKSGLIDS